MLPTTPWEQDTGKSFWSFPGLCLMYLFPLADFHKYVLAIMNHNNGYNMSLSRKLSNLSVVLGTPKLEMRVRDEDNPEDCPF